MLINQNLYLQIKHFHVIYKFRTILYLNGLNTVQK